MRYVPLEPRRVIWIVVGLAIIFAVIAHGFHLDPLSSWAEMGTLDIAPVSEAIKQDALKYFNALPTEERGRVWDMGDFTY